MRTWGVYKKKVTKCGNLSSSIQPEWHWVFVPYYGLHETRNKAKIAWYKDNILDETSDSIMVREFDQQYRNLKLAKVMRVDVKGN